MKTSLSTLFGKCALPLLLSMGVSIGIAKPAYSANVVTTLQDEDDGTSDPSVGTGTSLREAINFCLANHFPQVIFNLPTGDRTITLTSALPTITSTLMMQSPPSGGGVKIARSSADGTPEFGLFRVVGTPYTSNTVTLSLTDVTLSNGKTSGNGGAISVDNAYLLLNNCTLAGNAAGSGGAIYSSTASDYSGNNNNYPVTTTTLRNCTLTDNSASHGGAIFVYQGKTILDSCTIVGNRGPAGSGAGLETTTLCRVEVGNSIIAGNLTDDATPTTNTDVAEPVHPPSPVFSIATNGYNLVGDGNAAQYFFAGTDRYNVPDADLKISALADNGGPTSTMAIVPSSPAFNSGSTSLSTDQRGNARPSGGRADIGAFEVTAPAQAVPSLVVTTLEDEDNGISDPSFGYGTSLREAIDTANQSGNTRAITFDLPAGNRTITLHRPLPSLGNGVSITGPTEGGGVTVTRFDSQYSSIFHIFKTTGSVTLANLTISKGHGASDAAGGGIYNTGTLTVTGCTFRDNEAGYGGGIYSNTSTNTDLITIRNCTFSGNQASDAGAAIYIDSGKAVIDSCTVFGNQSYSTGGAVAAYSSTGNRTEIGNSIIGGTTNQNNAPAPDVTFVGANASAFVSRGDNLIGDGNATSQFNVTGDRTGVADDALKLGPLTDNGGPTFTMALLTGSPAINSAGAVYSSLNGIPTVTAVDQRGISRPQAGRSDIGAFEAVNPTFNRSVVVTTLEDEDNGTSDPIYGSGTSLREAIADANADPDVSNITFNLPAGNRTINLLTSLPLLSTDLSITGPTSGGGVTVARSSISGTPDFRVFDVNGKTVSLANITISGGRANVGGGVNNNSGNLTITACTFTGNSVQVYGGAIFSATSGGLSGATISVRNSTFTGNRGAGYSAIYNETGKMTLDSCTVTGNFGSNGAVAGVVSNSARIEIRNSIIAGNLDNSNPPASAPDIVKIGYVSENFVSLGHNLIGDSGSYEAANAIPLFNAPGDQVNVADSALKLGPLADNGGPTQTIALLPGSPAYNAGDTDLTTDQRGTSRPQASVDDIGAFEQFVDTTPPAPIVSTPTQNQSLTIASFNAITGTATDNVGVSQVLVKLFRTGNNVTTFWNGSSFGAAQVLLPAVVATPSATSTTWSFPVTPELKSALDLGAYAVAVYGKDAAGNQSGAVGRNFNLIADAMAPVPVINTPTQNQTLTVAAFNSITGTATDNIGVAQVFVKLFRVRNGVTEFWNGTSFGAVQVLLPANVTSPGSTGTAWNFPVTAELKAALDEGAYLLAVYAKDGAGNQSGAVGRNFTLNNDVSAPVPVISSPTQNQSLSVASFNSITGTATDNVGVTQVLIKLFRTRNGVTEFWNGTSFGAAQVLLPTTLATPGATSTSWSYTITPELKAALDAGAYFLTAYGKDAAGNQSGAVGRNFSLTTSGTLQASPPKSFSGAAS